MILGIPLIDGALIGITAFNIVMSLWLGATILLNAERRSVGVWLAGLGMFGSALFFGFHAVMLDAPFANLPGGLFTWWYVGWLPIIILPFGWYIAILWFAGRWGEHGNRLGRLHRWAPYALGAAVVATIVMVYQAHQLPPRYGPLPIFLILFNQTFFAFVIYGFVTIAALALAVHALFRLGPQGHVIADIARRRARPWLIATTFLQIAVLVVAACTIAWLLTANRHGLDPVKVGLPLAWIDLAASAMVAAAIAMVGNAIVSYEIFTGKILPRQGLRRHWHTALFLAAAIGAGTGVAMQLDLPRLAILLGAAVVVALFYALLNWRSYASRRRFLAHLRPFVGSSGLYEGIVDAVADVSTARALDEPFHALAGNVLGARRAHIVPLGALAALMPEPLSFPSGARLRTDAIPDVAALAGSGNELCIPIDGATGAQDDGHSAAARDGDDGPRWLIPLWSERGLIGGLLLGEKIDGGLYTQEEMEIARASGERLLDQFAATEMARRLVMLQRQRLAQSQVADARTRRVLHDDLLPQIHAAILALGANGTGAAGDAVVVMSGVHRAISDLLRELPMPVAPELERLGVIGTLRSMVSGEFRGAFDEVRWSVPTAAEEALHAISPTAAEVLYYAAREAIRNAARYGRRIAGDVPLVLEVAADEHRITIADNGDGIDAARGSAGGFTGGSGQGLLLHGAMMAVIGGELAVESTRGEGTRVTLRLGTAPRRRAGFSS